MDDELSVRDSLAKWFREEGYEVTIAESANEALTRVAEQTYDLALLDIKMRGTDGVELQRKLHELVPDLIVIMMTGYASVETAVTDPAQRRLRLHHQAARSRRDRAPCRQGVSLTSAPNWKTCA